MPGPTRVPYAVRLLRAHVTGPAAPAFDLTEPDGERHRVEAADAAPAFTHHLRTERAWRALGSLDETRIAEAYLHGDIDRAGRAALHGVRGGKKEVRRERLHLPLRLSRRPHPGGPPRALRRGQPNGPRAGGLHNDRHSYYLTLQAWARNLEAARGELVERYGKRVFRLFQIYLWAGALLHRDGGLEAYRLVFQKGKHLPSSALALGASGMAPA